MSTGVEVGRSGLHRFRSQVRVLRLRTVQHEAGTGSLQHNVFEVLLQDGVLDGMENEADVFSVHRRGEVVEERFASVPPLTAE